MKIIEGKRNDKEDIAIAKDRKRVVSATS